ncbi:MAG: hypothetical protein JKY13_01620, partial [Gammaproteobacteria bacterium]|nr:hypothetical protein [Gammaproteobacteria bacterium]
GNVGIGTGSPNNALDIKGGAVIGTGYAGSSLAPADSLLVERAIGIGVIPDVDNGVNLAVNGKMEATDLRISQDARIENNVTIVGNLEILGSTTLGSIEYGAGDVEFGASDADLITIRGQLNSTHSSGLLQVDDGMQVFEDLIVDGKVGIGADILTNKFEVKGNATIGTAYSGTSTNAPTDGLLVKGAIGVGTTTPKNKLDLAGNAVIGRGYAGVETALDDSLLVEGSAGVGTATPLNQLDVAGNTVIGSTYAGTTMAPTNGLLVEGNMGIGATAPSINLAIADNDTGLSATTDNLSIVTAGTERIKVNATGQVGIGTTTPFNQLDIIGNTVIGTSYAGSVAAPSDGLLVEGSVGIGVNNPSNKLEVKGAATIGNAYAGTATTAPTNGLLVEGAVGIGTTPDTANGVNLAVAGKVDVSDLVVSNDIAIDNNAVITGTLDVTGATHFVGDMLCDGNVTLGNQDTNTISIIGQLAAASGSLEIVDPLQVNDSVTVNGDIDITNSAKTFNNRGNAIIGASYVDAFKDGKLNPPADPVLNPPLVPPSNGLLIEGKLGLGTSTPRGKFDVKGAVIIGDGFASDVIPPSNGLLVNGALGLGTASILNKVEIAGNAAIGSLYAGIETAPSNGLLVEGNVGIHSNDAVIQLAIGDSDTGLQSSADDTLSVMTGNTERIHIHSDGNIGIGIETPLSKLDINGGLAVGISFAGTQAAPSNGLLVEANVGIGTNAPVNLLDVGGAAVIGANYASSATAPSNGLLIEGDVAVGVNTADIQFALGDSDTGLQQQGDDELGIFTNNVERVRVSSTGNVGIGTNAPKNNCDISGNLAIGSFAGVYAAPANSLIISNVLGIGTSAPLNALDVAGGGAIGSAYAGVVTVPNNGLLVEGNIGIGTSSAGLQFSLGDSGTGFQQQGENELGIFTGSTERIRIAPTGQVGIGTNIPQNALDIVGSSAIGATYAGGIAAPTNGLLVEGKVGIGTSVLASDVTLAVAGKAEATDLSASNDLSVANNAVITGNLDVTGTTHFVGDTQCDGNVTLGSQNTSQISVVGQLSAASGTLEVIDPLQVNDHVIMTDETKSFSNRGNAVVGASYVDDTELVLPANGLLVEGKVGIGTSTLASDITLAVAGKVAATDFIASNDIDITNNAMIGGTLDVTGATRFIGSTQCDGNVTLGNQSTDQISVVGQLSAASGTLTVAGNFQLSSGGAVNSFSADATLGAAGSSDAMISTQKAVKVYVDDAIAAANITSPEQVIRINTQAEFEQTFGSGTETTIAANSTIILGPIDSSATTAYNGRPAYLLKNAVNLSSQVSIVGHNIAECIIVKSAATDKFNVAGADTNNLVQNINLTGWSFDGQGGVNSYSGTLEAAGNGGAFALNFCHDIVINCKIVNHKTTGDGGAIYATSDATRITAEHIYDCQAAHGGGIAGGVQTKIAVYNCVATIDGGGVYSSTNATIIAEACSAVNGGAVHSSDQITLTANNCVVTGNGSAAYECDYLIGLGHWLNNTADVTIKTIFASSTNRWLGVFAVDNTAVAGTTWQTTDV